MVVWKVPTSTARGTTQLAAIPGCRKTRRDRGRGPRSRMTIIARAHPASREPAPVIQDLDSASPAREHASPTAVAATRTIRSARVGLRQGGLAIVGLVTIAHPSANRDRWA